MNAKQFRVSHGLTQSEVADIIRRRCPLANAACVSLAERSVETGVEYTKEAKRALRASCELKTRIDSHTRHGRISCRIPDEDFALLRVYLTENKLEVQGWLEPIIAGWIKENLSKEAG